MTHPARSVHSPMRSVDILLRRDLTVGVSLWGPSPVRPFDRLGHFDFSGASLSTPEAVLLASRRALCWMGWGDGAVEAAARLTFPALDPGRVQTLFDPQGQPHAARHAGSQ